MTLFATLIIALATGSAGNPEFCRDIENGIEPDMRILQSDLTREAAVEASHKLQGMIERGDLDGEFTFGALNQTKIIYGHILLRQAKADRIEFGQDSVELRDSEQALCNWLSREGFWFD